MTHSFWGILKRVLGGEALERFTHDYLPTLKPWTQERYRTSFRQLAGGWVIQPVQKAPSLTVAGSWLSTVVSTVELAVSKTICFQVRRLPRNWSPLC